MSSEAKKRLILEMFSSYPSFSLNQEQTAISTSSYLQVLSGFEPNIVEATCLVFRKKSAPFPPSAGELFAECERQAVAAQKRADFDLIGRRQPKFTQLAPRSRHGWTAEQLADWELIVNGQDNPYSRQSIYVMRADENGAKLRIPVGYPGAGQEVAYGYLTPKEAAHRWTPDNLDAYARETLR
jgi:hypothetical protein